MEMRVADRGRRYEFWVYGGVAAFFAGLILLLVDTMGAPTGPDPYRDFVIAWAVLSAPSLIAARLLWRAWWRRRGARVSASPDGLDRLHNLDRPARLLDSAVAALPDRRRDWGAAMTAELAQVEGTSTRWRFAVGCARTAVFPPSVGSRVPLLVVAATTAAAVPVTAWAAEQSVPGIRVFAVTFVVLVGGLALLAVTRRPWRTRRPASGLVLAVTVSAGVAGCVALTTYTLATDPAVGRTLGAGHAVLLALGLAVCLGLVLGAPRALTSSRVARLVGLGAGMALGAGLLLTSRAPGGESGVMGYLLLGQLAAFFLAGAVTAAVRRSLRPGVQAVLWTAVVGVLLLFVVFMAESLRRNHPDASAFSSGEHLLLDGDFGPLGTNLKDAVFWILVFVPAWGLPFGVMGAALGARLTRRRGRRLGAKAAATQT